MTAPPCLACPDRRIGCHDPAVCPQWAAYEAIHRAELAAMPSRKEWVDMVEYIHDRRSAEVVAEHVYFGDSKQRSESDTPPASGDFREIPEDEEGELPF